MTKKKFEIILDILMILSGLAGAIGASVTHTKPLALLILGGLRWTGERRPEVDLYPAQLKIRFEREAAK